MINNINIRVDRDLCYACGVCVDRCIMDNLRLSVAPCRQQCPLHMNAQGYVRLLAQGKPEEALKEMAPYLPFIGILGRVCHHPCEAVCERTRQEGAVGIRALKRHLADRFTDTCLLAPECAADTGKRAVVVGSGPAGLMAAYHLRRQGHGVTVLESETEPGGCLRFAIPDFRLPVAEVERTVSFLEGMGIRFRTGTALGRDKDLEELASGSDAVVLALGAGEPIRIAPSDCAPDLISSAIDLLRRVKKGERPDIGKSVAVIGGGNTAVDAALVSRRLGAKEVRIICLENPSEMPAFRQEIDQAREEGILFENCWSPMRLNKGKDGSIEIELSRCISVYDEKGCFSPEIEPVCGLRLKADTILSAIGFRTEAGYLPEAMRHPESGRLAADPEILVSPFRSGIFVCGDCFTGPASVVDALASGQEAAVSADRFLRGEGLRWGRSFFDGSKVSCYEPGPNRAAGRPKISPQQAPLSQRGMKTEVEKTLSAEEALEEAERCLSCGRSFESNKTCWYCLPCEIECPVHALEVRMPYLVR
ncbi:MAG: FAD-dependent oxidoreductase [Desulfobacteraceae bacterium]|nr:MAG: FAD-dependent oxidoreductase [Desulfobacteraceae bacterium]